MLRDTSGFAAEAFACAVGVKYNNVSVFICIVFTNKKARGRYMQNSIHMRVITCAQHIAQTGATVRETAKLFGISKSTVHKDVTEKLPLLDSGLAKQVYDVLQLNKAQRHIRGGIATHIKYKGDTNETGK